jgi:FAD/FMN-containing dehydrogenase/SAM-dependent methyltransferase
VNSAPAIINDITGLNPIPVAGIVTPLSIADVQTVVRTSKGALSVGGGHFSMGGHTASPGSLHIDMRTLNKVVRFSPQERSLRVQAGIRWCDIQKFIDPHDLSVKIMQTYANFTVGGSLSVNVHGRYINAGPLILSVRAIAVVLADGSLVEATPEKNAEIFYGAIGGYGGLGIIVEAELELADNTRIQRIDIKLPAARYVDHFLTHVLDSGHAVFHNADIYPPHYRKLRSVTWIETGRRESDSHRLMSTRKSYPLHRYFMWAITETPFGKWRREFIVDPLIYLRSPVHWRNYEAGYDVAELEPVSRSRRTYVLQEYFVPVARFSEFLPKMVEILTRHRVNVINISVRHARKDSGSLLAWAPEDVFAFVLYHKQRVRSNARNRVSVWTRELIEAALQSGGTYYLPYQIHATADQFHRAYPRAHELFALKRRLDPQYRLRGALWDAYYAPTLERVRPAIAADSEFHTVFSDLQLHDSFYRFLQNIYHLYPEDRFHTLIKEACARHSSDESIYRHIQATMRGIKPPLADITYAIPALFKQKREMLRETLEILGNRRRLNGYLEIGSTGRYISVLRRHLELSGELLLVNDVAPGYSPVDIIERGSLKKTGRFVPLSDYAPIERRSVADNSLDLVTCYIGLHHAAPEVLDGFVRSIHRVLRPNGLLILRDHDVTTPQMRALVSLAHAVFNAGLGLPWETNHRERRHFRPVSEWSHYLQSHGFEDSGQRRLQPNDPTANVLMAFSKNAARARG